MSYRKSRERHFMSMTGGAAYMVCGMPGCSRVRRTWWRVKPLIHKGGKP